MTTVYTQFTPSATSNPPFQFTATLDSNQYVISVTYNVYGERWYITCADTNGDIIRTEPLISSPPDNDIPMLPGLFSDNTLVYRDSSNNFEVS